jgi:deoxyribodipyrimidine photo-lyase
MEKYGHSFFMPNGIKKTGTQNHKHNPVLFEQWMNGETGNDFIDANMLELKLSGFMSNRGRQNVASYLCHNLKLDWRYGAAYFEQQLVELRCMQQLGKLGLCGRCRK